MNFKKNKKTIFISVGIVVVALVISLGIVFKSTAQSPNIFGGYVTNVFFCDCPDQLAFLLTISPPVGGQFIFQPGTPQFPFGSLPGTGGYWTLGIYSPGAVCLIYTGKSCEPFGAPIGTITPIVGSSLPGF